MEAGMCPASRGGSAAAAWSPPRRLQPVCRAVRGARTDVRLRERRARAIASRARVPRAVGRDRRRRRRRDQGARRRRTTSRSTTTADAADFTAANLAQLPRRGLPQQRGRPLNAAQETALQGYIQAGGGFVGIGSRGRGRAGHTFVTGLIGARPDAGEPDRRRPTRSSSFGDRVHPSTKGLPLEWTRNDIWYRWTTRPTGTVHTVARYRALGAAAGDGTDHGRHRLADLLVPRLPGRPLLLHRHGPHRGRLRRGRLQEAPARRDPVGRRASSAAAARPRSLSNYSTERVVSAASGDLTNSGESHGVVAGQQRLGDLHRPRRLPHRRRARRDDRPGLARRSILDFANRNVGVGCGTSTSGTRRPTTAPSTAASRRPACWPSTATAAGGNEVNGKIETGLLGVAAAPDFAQTGHIYLQYFPTFNPDNPVHPGLADGDQRRITKMAQAAHLALHDQPADQEARPRLRGRDLRVRRRRSTAAATGRRHGLRLRGQPLRHHRRHELVAEHQRLLGQQPAASAARPVTRRRRPTRTAAPTTSRINDARRTAGNTNDYNGKMLRFNPIDDARRTGRSRGRRRHARTRCRPPTSPERPEPVRRHRGRRRQGQARDLRDGPAQPVALSIDPKTDVPYAAWVGPDAGAPSRDPGSVDVRERRRRSPTRATTAGRTAWATSRPTATASPTARCAPTNAPGYVTGGPAAGGPTAGTTATTSSTTRPTTPA